MNKLKRKPVGDPATGGQHPTLRAVDGRAETSGTPAVQVLHLRRTYPGGVEAVKGIDFEVAPAPTSIAPRSSASASAP